jgi:hypothetical protein
MLSNISDVGIWLYDIGHCGYYAGVRIANAAQPLFGGMSQTLTQLEAWSTGRVLGRTCTFSIPDDSDLTEVFLLGMAKGENGDYLLALWNRLPGSETNIASVGVADVVGSASASIATGDVHRIPGYATYFLIMPSAGKIATIRLKHSSNGIPNFRNYIASFLSDVNAAHVVIDDTTPNGSDLVISGYRKDSSSLLEQRPIRAAFQVKPIPLGGDTTYLKDHVDQIKKVIYKTSLTSISPREMSFWQSLQEMGRIFALPAPLREEFPIKVEIPVDLDAATFDATVKAWNDGDDGSGSRTHDIGFIVTGETVPRWLSRSQARTVLQLGVEWIDAEIVNIEALFTQLQLQRTAILNIG